MGVTQLIFKLNYFKRKISAILKPLPLLPLQRQLRKLFSNLLDHVLLKVHTVIVLQRVVIVQKYRSELHINQY